MSYTGGNCESRRAKESGSRIALIGWGQGKEQWIIASDPEVSHGVFLSGSLPVWFVGTVYYHETRVETEVKTQLK